MAKQPNARKLRHLPYGIGRLHTNAVRRGVIGGSRSWMFIGLLIWVPRAASRFLGKQERTVARDTLLPGQFVRIEAFRKPSKKEMKQANKQSKKAAKGAK